MGGQPVVEDLPVAVAAALVGMRRQSFGELVKNGRIASTVTDSGRRRVPIVELQRLLKRRITANDILRAEAARSPARLYQIKYRALKTAEANWQRLTEANEQRAAVPEPSAW